MFKKINKFFQKRFDRFYRRRRWQLLLDIGLIVVILILGVAVLSLHFYKPEIGPLDSWLNPEKNNNGNAKIIEAPLEISFSWEDKIVIPGEKTVLNMRLKNISSFDVSNYEIKISSKNNNYLASGDFRIEKITANSEAVFPIEVTIAAATKNSADKIASLRATYKYQVNKQAFQASNDLEDIKIVSELNVSAAAYYNSPQGDQLGSGPLPPVVGLPTNLWVFLKVEADGNFSDFSLSAKLSKNVELTENSSLLSGELNYNEAARQIVWRNGEIKAGSSEHRAGFEVQLIPSEEQIGKFATLLNQFKFQATDVFTGAKVEGTITEVNTGLEADSLNRGEGKIISLDNE